MSLNLVVHEAKCRRGRLVEEMGSSYEFSRNGDNKDVSLQELRDRLAEFAQVRGWDQYHSPRNLLLALVSSFQFKPQLIYLFHTSY